MHPEDVGGRAAAAECEDGVSECAAALGHGGLVVQAHLLKRAEGVGRQHLRPLVAEVAGRVAPCEYVAEAAQEPASAHAPLSCHTFAVLYNDLGFWN